MKKAILALTTAIELAGCKPNITRDPHTPEVSQQLESRFELRDPTAQEQRAIAEINGLIDQNRAVIKNSGPIGEKWQLIGDCYTSTGKTLRIAQDIVNEDEQHTGELPDVKKACLQSKGLGNSEKCLIKQVVAHLPPKQAAQYLEAKRDTVEERNQCVEKFFYSEDQAPLP